MNFAIRFRELRIAKGKSRKEVAEDLGCSVSAIQMYENGERTPKDSLKLIVANYFGVTVEFLFFDQQEHELCPVAQSNDAASA